MSESKSADMHVNVISLTLPPIAKYDTRRLPYSSPLLIYLEIGQADLLPRYTIQD